jgi:ribosomal protein S18 acetylase RimI-like enzyme
MSIRLGCSPRAADAILLAVEYRPYELEDLLQVVTICEADDWGSLASDPERAHRVLTNPGVTSYVALDHGIVVGFAYLLSDGEVQAYLALMAVAATHRRRGIGGALIQESFRGCGAERLDLLSIADSFYESLVHQRWNGFRLYPPFIDAPRAR